MFADVAEWYTRTVQNRIPQGLEVRVLSSALSKQKRVNLCRGGEKKVPMSWEWHTQLCFKKCGRGGIWYTRTIEVRIPKGLEVQVLSSAQYNICSRALSSAGRASRLHRGGRGFDPLSAHNWRQIILKILNQNSRDWEPATHEDPQDPGVLKKVVVRHDEVNRNSKLMMVNLCKVPIGKTHKAHSHKAMEEIFYFTEGEGEVRVEEEIETVGPGDRIIVPATHVHQIKNTGNTELKYIGIGVALD